MKNLFTYPELVVRNMGLFSVAEQKILKNSKVVIAGCGGAGGEAAVTIARMGVCAIALADPDTFESSNLNRQFGSSVNTIGKNKASVIADEIKKVNPFCKVTVFSDGISESNVDQFLKGANLVIEEIDFTEPYYSALLHRRARKKKIPVLTGVDVSWGAFLLVFLPDSLSFEEYIGLDSECDLELLKEHNVPITAYAPELPAYLDAELLESVGSGKIDVPVVGPSVCLTSGIVSAFTGFLLTGMKELAPAPYYYYTGDLLMLEPKLNMHYKDRGLV